MLFALRVVIVRWWWWWWGVGARAGGEAEGILFEIRRRVYGRKMRTDSGGGPGHVTRRIDARARERCKNDKLVKLRV